MCLLIIINNLTFQEIELKATYDSDEDDVLNDFYLPVLSKAKKYHRLAGFFSSSILALAAEGLASFITNNGKMKLIVGAILNKNDVEAIKNGISDPKDIIITNFLNDIDSIKDAFLLDHIKALSWMVAQGTLDIKIAIPLDSNDNPLSLENATSKGIFHQKVGILVDEKDNKISFSGSINESAYGWLNNVEEFKVFKSWILNEHKYLSADIDKFNKYDRNIAKNTIILSMPEAIKLKLLKIAPNNWDESLLTKHIPQELRRRVSSRKISLWPHQKQAVESWIKNEYKGIFAMATGSGKTIAALSAVNMAPLNYLTIILVPTIPLLYQWIEEIEGFDATAEIIPCSGEHSWKEFLSLKLAIYRNIDFQSKLRNRLYIVSTMHTASSDSFLIALKGIPKENIQVICDEVHHMGAPTFQKCMKITSTRTLGLSATPERQWDFEGTRKTIEYIGHTVFEYSLADAIKDGYLAKYKYYPSFAYLDEDEFFEYKKYTNQINRIIAMIKSKNKISDDIIHHKTPKLEKLLRERAMIKKKARDKIRAFEEIYNKNVVKPIIVFCEDTEQLDEINDILKKEKALIYTSDMNPWQQAKTLEVFKKGDVDTLLAIRCLDEGLDVPECKGAIIIASSSSTREFVQRRGRILRGQKDKIALLYDLIVLPTLLRSKEETEIATQLITQEMNRMKQLVDCSENEWETRSIIRKELEKHNLEHLAFL